jgi:putative spermidine/putrescine transport system permease protein
MQSRLSSLLLVAPALSLVAALFLYPLGFSLASAFTTPQGIGLDNFAKSFELYRTDILFTFVIIAVSTALIGGLSIAIGGYLTLGGNATAVAILAWIYRWPLFVPFIVAAQCMRTFLAKNGLMNNALAATGLLDVTAAQSFLDWRGIIITFVWKQTPFVALMVAGAMAALDRSTIEAARNLGASRLRILIEIVVPQVSSTLLVGLILSFVTMMSVLSVPLMVSGGTPTMLTVDMAYRINSATTASPMGSVSSPI